MTMTKADPPRRLTRLYPTAHSYIPGVPAIEQDVDEARAAELLAYTPPAFTTDPAEAATAPVQAYHVLPVIEIPATEPPVDSSEE